MKLKENKLFGIAAVLLAAAVCTSCATTGSGGMSLEGAIMEAAANLEARLEAGTKIALLNFSSPREEFSAYVLEELSGFLVNGGRLVVVDRRELDLIRQEEQFQLSGEVSDESAQSIGKKLGAQVIVSGSLTGVGRAYRFRVQALEVETAAVAAFSAVDLSLRDAKTAALLAGASPPRPAGAPAPQPGAVPAGQTGQRILPQDLAEVFGTSDVAATFNAVHAFLQTCNTGSAEGRRELIAGRIMLGDWIDLPHLTVQGDGGGGAINTGNVDLGGNGKLLRLIVAGIDSFAATNRDAPAHIVFQFQNTPGMHRMNASHTNAGGYRGSGMRTYLTGNFLRGLMAAGVPEGVLYAPTRYVANGGGRATAADALKDWLWLPTEWELFGENRVSNGTWETAATQARLEYYEGDSRRTKYGADGKQWLWWEASPSVYVSAGY
ncbi:MAG: CsgG/HfaB family protein, partial [Treponema sp.]|nr:CsgG/HfaB family protein [Treponema sp.]